MIKMVTRVLPKNLLQFLGTTLYISKLITQLVSLYIVVVEERPNLGLVASLFFSQYSQEQMDIIAIRILVDLITSVVLHIVNPKVMGPSPIIGGPLVQNNYHSSGMYPPTLRTCIIIGKIQVLWCISITPQFLYFCPQGFANSSQEDCISQTD